MTVTVRFAPSPTGYIHIGNARTALFNWMFAAQSGGRFILRLDDTDIERSTRHFAEQIVRDLRWLGIEPDAVESQSERMAIHDAAAAALKKAGLLYPCYETSEELERRRKIRLTRKLPPVYGREALKLDEAGKASFEADGRKPHWRFLLPNFKNNPFETERTEVNWNDVIRGPQSVDLASMSDPVLIREDGSYLYTLPSVADDIEMGISHIIRGDDHVTNTAAQIALFQALGARAPEFGHHNLLTTLSGEGLSKRTGSLSLKGLAEKGYEPMAVASLAVLIGTSEPVRAFVSLDELAVTFKPEMASKSAAKFDPAELDGLNRTLVQQLSFDAISDRLAELGIEGDCVSEFWEVIRGNIDKVDEAADWWRIICDGPGEIGGLSEDDQQFVSQAFELLPNEPWDNTTWQKWTDSVKQKTGRKGKALFLPLRLALTGRTAGPELANLLPLLDREGILARLP